jgi:hypothetical protein
MAIELLSRCSTARAPVQTTGPTACVPIQRCRRRQSCATQRSFCQCDRVSISPAVTLTRCSAKAAAFSGATTAPKKIASTSSVLKAIQAGSSNYHLRAGYIGALRVKIERVGEVAQSKLAPPASKKHAAPLSTSAPLRRSVSAPAKPKMKTTGKAVSAMTLHITAPRDFAQIGDDSVQVPAKRQGAHKQFPDFEWFGLW